MEKADESVIPRGPYCYASHEPMDERGIIKLVGMCPYWVRGADRAYCRFLGEHDDELGLLTDQVKICGVNSPDGWFEENALAQGIEAATAAETVEQDSVHESPVGNADAPKGVGHAQ